MTEKHHSAKALFDTDSVFGDDYLHFYGPDLTAKRNEREADVVWRLLSLAPGDAVLDLGCGHGRIAIELAKRGVQVTGLDASADFLDLARKATASAGLHIDYIKGDMRDLSSHGMFDAAVIWFTTFGYFDDDDNKRVLDQAANILKPGGRLLIEQVHRNALLRQELPQRFVTERGDDLLIDLVDYDARAEQCKTERIVVRDGDVRRTTFAVRLYGLAELSGLLKVAGFSSVDGFGREGDTLTTYSRRLLTLAKKAP